MMIKYMPKTMIRLAALALVSTAFADESTSDTRSWGTLISANTTFETEFPSESDVSGEQAIWVTNGVALAVKTYDIDLDDPAPASEAGEKYLHFTTEVDTALTRSLTKVGNDRVDVEMGTVYMDAFLRIPAIDFVPEVGQDAKLALYLKDNGDGNEATLTVICGTFFGEPGTNTVALNCAIEPNTWHRYRIETYGDKNPDASFGAFTISVDGVKVGAAAAVELIDPDYVAELFPNERERALYAERKIFPTLIPWSDQRAATLTAACFQGSADLDELTIAEQAETRDNHTLAFVYANPEDAANMTIFVNYDELVGTSVELVEGTAITVFVQPKDNWGFEGVPTAWTKAADGTIKLELPQLTEDQTVTIPALTAKERLLMEKVEIVVQPNTTLEAIAINWTALDNAQREIEGARQGDVIRLTFAAAEGYELSGESEMTVPLAYGVDRLEAKITGPSAYLPGGQGTGGSGTKTMATTFKLAIHMEGNDPVVTVEQLVTAGTSRLRMAATPPKVVIHGSNDLKTWEPILDKTEFKKYHFFKGVIEDTEE